MAGSVVAPWSSLKVALLLKPSNYTLSDSSKRCCCCFCWTRDRFPQSISLMKQSRRLQGEHSQPAGFCVSDVLQSHSYFECLRSQSCRLKSESACLESTFASDSHFMRLGKCRLWSLSKAWYFCRYLLGLGLKPPVSCRSSRDLNYCMNLWCSLKPTIHANYSCYSQSEE